LENSWRRVGRELKELLRIVGEELEESWRRYGGDM